MIEIFTDGACSPNPGAGGWAFVTKDGTEISGSETPSTNQRMEMTAVFKAIEHFKNHQEPILIVTDSKFVITGCTDWMHGWARKDWQKAGGGEVKNRDLWEKLFKVYDPAKISFKWVRGHSGDYWNERADALAVQAREAIK